VRVLNLSLSGQFSSRIERDALAVIRTSRPDLVVVAAAGNDGRELPNSPAGLDGVLSVGASGQGGDGQWRVASFSNRGDVDVLAPGVAVTSWWDGQLEALDGTSFAAPEVAAVAAGLVAVGVTGDRARAAIVASAEAPVTSDVVATASGSGRADALAAVTLATGSVPTSPWPRPGAAMSPTSSAAARSSSSASSPNRLNRRVRCRSRPPGERSERRS